MTNTFLFLVDDLHVKVLHHEVKVSSDNSFSKILDCCKTVSKLSRIYLACLIYFPADARIWRYLLISSERTLLNCIMSSLQFYRDIGRSLRQVRGLLMHTHVNVQYLFWHNTL